MATSGGSRDAMTRAAAAVVTVLLGVPFLLLAAKAVASRFDAAVDPHGYALIFGVVLAVPLGIGVGVVAPLMLPKARRGAGYAVSRVLCAVLVVGLFALLVTAD